MIQTDSEATTALIITFLQIGLPILLLFIWWSVGMVIEKKHLKSLLARESKIGDIQLTNLKGFSASVNPAHPVALVCGEVAIASDAFKRFVFGFRNIFGGESAYYCRLFARARREALLRMIDQAKSLGYDAICNIRFDSSDIGGNAAGAGKKKNMDMAVCMVSGTAYLRARNEENV